MHALSKSLEIKPYMLNVEIYMLQETIMHDCHHRPRQRCQVVPHGLQRHRVTISVDDQTRVVDGATRKAAGVTTSM